MAISISASKDLAVRAMVKAFARAIAAGAAFRAVATSRSTAAFKSASSATIDTSPKPSARSAVMTAPVINTERTAAEPMRAMTKGPMVAGINPSFVSVRANFARRLAMVISATAISPKPPPNALP